MWTSLVVNSAKQTSRFFRIHPRWLHILMSTWILYSLKIHRRILLTRQHIKTFDGWFRRKLLGNNTVDQELQWLARGPSITVQQYQGYEINGYTFYTRAQDKKSTNQNSGVRMCIVNSNGEKNNYYGVIEEIWELEYGPIVVPLFRCEWVAGGGVTNDRYGMTIVDF